ncbi:MAG: NADH-quinone oxidoreductase subunit NuoF [Planctomycetota bacterium]
MAATAPLLHSSEDLEALRARLRASRTGQTRQIAVCAGTGCRATGAEAVVAAFRAAVEAAGLSEKVAVTQTGCHGFCERGPLVVIRPDEIFYNHVTPEDAPRVVQALADGGGVLPDLLYTHSRTGERYEREGAVPFYARQKRIVFRHNGLIDPESIDDYIAAGGYRAAVRALFEMTPEAVIDEIDRSGLRGRGGGGFPTGRKWRLCREAGGDKKYVICNGDEGDPGAFMDRSIMEGDPHAVLEGMLIGAYAIGAREAVIYVRSEYPLALVHLHKAIERAVEYGLLGRDILGSGTDLSIRIFRGAGAFVCGEETALLASIEGRRGMPRLRPPFPAESGLWGAPTNINNVETWANVPVILERGAEWFAAIGTPGSKGTKVFSLVGKVENTGLVEVPMGITLREIVEDIGGGVRRGALKAVQLGGPSGGCIPASLLDTPVDYEAVNATGAIMGSGGLVVMDDETCMVDIARFFLDFTQKESCGECTFCRIGTKRMLEILTRITEGEGRPEDLPALEELSRTIKKASLCGLGQTAPNPVLTTLRYFRDEYEAHIREKRCPARQCRRLLSYAILAGRCVGCAACAKVCPAGAISGRPKELHAVDPATCIRCGLCVETCRYDAIEAK